MRSCLKCCVRRLPQLWSLRQLLGAFGCLFGKQQTLKAAKQLLCLQSAEEAQSKGG